jgi:glycerate kinase
LPALRVLGAADVTNPLLGPSGASAVYGPQKGATAAEVEVLDAALARLADVIERDLGPDVRDIERGGAAGGLGAGLVAFLGAELREGAEIVADATGLDRRAAAADLVITGEGRLDGQTVFGKSTARVARAAAAAGKPVICLAGSLGAGHEEAARLFTTVEVLEGGEAANALGAAALRAMARIGLS